MLTVASFIGNLEYLIKNGEKMLEIIRNRSETEMKFV